MICGLQWPAGRLRFQEERVRPVVGFEQEARLLPVPGADGGTAVQGQKPLTARQASEGRAAPSWPQDSHHSVPLRHCASAV